jgi:hypothetical protein
MARGSYLRSFVGGPAKDTALLRPQHLPHWGARQQAQDLRKSLFDPEDAAPGSTSHSSEFPATSRFATPGFAPQNAAGQNVASLDPAERSGGSTEASVSLAHGVKTTKSASIRQDDAQFATEISPAHSIPTSQLNAPGGKQHNARPSHAAESSIARSAVPHPESGSDILRAAADASAASTLSQLKKDAVRSVADLVPRRGPSTPEATDHRSSDHQSFLQSSLQPGLRPRSPATDPTPAPAGSLRPASGSTKSEGRKVVEDEAAKGTPNFRIAIPFLRPLANGQVPAKQHEVKSSGNSIHIGNVDIHIVPPPAPVVRQPARQRAALTAMARGFTSSFGLNQG